MVGSQNCLPPTRIPYCARLAYLASRLSSASRRRSSAVYACHTPLVVAIAHDASCQRIQVHPLIVGQLHIAGAEIPLQIF